MARDRLVSLDAFRGLTIAAMILVNNPAAEANRYWILRHAAWDGCRPADVIFPAFLFIAGVSNALSFAGRRDSGATVRVMFDGILRRSFIIFGLGLLLNALPYFDWEIVRVPGVLQRIALAYLAASLIALRWGPKGQTAAAVFLLLLYWALMFLVPVPGYGRGVLEPESNLGAYLDRVILGTHLAHREWDPEGLLGTLPSIASVLAGTLAGEWLLETSSSAGGKARFVRGLVYAGVVGVLVGLLLGRWFPINKSLWSSPYVLFTSGVSALAFAGFFWLVEVRGYSGWTTAFLVFGSNPILTYWLSSFVAKLLELPHVTRANGRVVFLETYLVDWLYTLAGSRPFASLLYSVLYTALWLALLTPLYRRGVLVKI